MDAIPKQYNSLSLRMNSGMSVLHPTPTPLASGGFQFKSFRDAEPNLSEVWLVKDWLLTKDFSFTVGVPASGKTFALIDIGVNIAGGTPALGKYRTERSAVVYASLEGNTRFENRVFAQRKFLIESGKLSPEADLPFGFMTYSYPMLRDESMLKRFIEEANKFAYAYGVPLGLIIIDTWNRALGGAEENGSADMGRAISMLDTARAESNAHINVVHHFGKDTSRGARGHSSINGAVDTEIQIFRNRKTKIHTIKLGKMKDAEDETECYFKLQSIPLGFDRYNEPVTSAVPIFLEAGDDGVSGVVPQVQNPAIAFSVGSQSNPQSNPRSDAEYGVLYIEFARQQISQFNPTREVLRKDFVDHLVENYSILLNTAQHISRRIEKKYYHEIEKLYKSA